MKTSVRHDFKTKARKKAVQKLAKHMTDGNATACINRLIDEAVVRSTTPNK